MQFFRHVALCLLLLAATPAWSHSLDVVQQQLHDKDNYFQPVDLETSDFALQDANGRPVTMADLRGKVVVLNFIYTNCGDLCPLQSEMVAQLQTMINATPMKDRVAFVTITTDPARDRGQVLSDYGAAHGLDPVNWMFLTTRSDQPEDTTRTLAKAYGLKFTKTEDGEQMHGAVIHVIDQDGRLRGRFHGLKFQPLTLVAFVNALTNKDLPDDEHSTSGPLDWLTGFFK